MAGNDQPFIVCVYAKRMSTAATLVTTMITRLSSSARKVKLDAIEERAHRADARDPECRGRDDPAEEETDRRSQDEARDEQGVVPGLALEARAEGDRREREDGDERGDREELPDDVVHDGVVDGVERAQEQRREPALAHEELELVRVPGEREVQNDRERDVVGGEIGDAERADRAAAGLRDRDPGREEDDRAQDREEDVEEELHPVLRRVLEPGDEERAVRPDHAVATGSSPLKMRSTASSMGGSSTDRSASRSLRSPTCRAVRSATLSRGTSSV